MGQPIVPRRELPLPPFYDPSHAASWEHRADAPALQAAAEAWRREHAIPPAALAGARVHLLVIDAQRDFCLPGGALFVGGRSGRGAVEDCDRLARFVYRHLGWLTEITCTLDTHHPFQIFFSSFWTDGEGRPLAPYREIRAEEVESGAVRPDSDLDWLGDGDRNWLARQALHYCRELERRGKYRLYLWPPHCLAGSAGHGLAGVIEEARLFFSFARRAPVPLAVKGEHPLVEHYSALSPEVCERHDGGVLATPDRALLERLLAADLLLVAGQASSHCVRATVEDLLAEAARRDPAAAGRIVLLEDCMSPVAVPDPAHPGGFLADFTGEAEAALARFAAAGAWRVRSTDPVAGWPGVGG